MSERHATIWAVWFYLLGIAQGVLAGWAFL